MNFDKAFLLRSAISLIVALVVVWGNRRQRHTLLQGMIAVLMGLVVTVALQMIMIIVLKGMSTSSDSLGMLSGRSEFTALLL